MGSLFVYRRKMDQAMHIWRKTQTIIQHYKEDVLGELSGKKMNKLEVETLNALMDDYHNKMSDETL